MTTAELHEIRALEGHTVSVALDDGTRLDAAVLICACRTHAQSLWLFIDGDDRFVPCTHVVAVWEDPRPRAA